MKAVILSSSMQWHIAIGLVITAGVIAQQCQIGDNCDSNAVKVSNILTGIFLAFIGALILLGVYRLQNKCRKLSEIEGPIVVPARYASPAPAKDPGNRSAVSSPVQVFATKRSDKASYV